MINRSRVGRRVIIRANPLPQLKRRPIGTFTEADVHALELDRAIESMGGFSRLRPLRQTARSYKAQVYVEATRNEFIKELKKILDDADFQYNINFSRTNIFITKYRVRDIERNETGYIEM